MPRVPSLPPHAFRRLDLNAVELGVPLERLMARAGKALAMTVLAQMGTGDAAKPTEAWFLCGKGNNGGDGLAAASLVLSQGRKVRVLLAQPDALRGPTAAFAAAIPKENVQAWTPALRTLRPPTGAVLVDCLLGTGAEGPPRAPYDAMLRWLQARRKDGHRVVACDVPSALGSRAAVAPHATVTFHARKKGMTRTNSGTVVVADIGIPPEADDQIGLGDLALAFGRLDADAHKGDNGRVLVVAGGPYSGAPWYAAMGAARTGADVVHVAAPSDAARAVAQWGPTPIVHATEPGDRFTPDSMARIEELLPSADAVVAGPGMGSHPDTLAFLHQLLGAVAKEGLPLLLDADGLDAVGPAFLRQHGRRTVLTPHAKEFLDLAGQEATESNVEAYARKHKVTLVRKGRVDVVTNGTTTRRCHRGHPTMTVGGTGDVLAGAIGALLARGPERLDPHEAVFQAACAGAYVVGCAGEVAGAILGPGAQATDVHEAIPSVLLRLA